jgi:hypothetical protein
MEKFLSDRENLLLNVARQLLVVHYGGNELDEKLAQLQKVYPLHDVVRIATTMACYHEPWWKSDDSNVRALNQLLNEVLLLEDMEAFTSDVETALGRSIGITQEQRNEALSVQYDIFILELQNKGIEIYNPIISEDCDCEDCNCIKDSN